MVIQFFIFFLLMGSIPIINADDDDSTPCASQFDTNIKCLLDLIGSDNAKIIENKTKDVFHGTCAPDYPLDCFSEFEAAKQCYVDTKSQLDVPGPLKTQKDAANAATDLCFNKKAGAGLLGGLEDVFFPSPIKVLSGNLGKSLWGGKLPIPVPPLAVIMKGLSGSTPQPPTDGSGSPTRGSGSGGNSTSDEGSENEDDGHQKLFGRKECTPKRAQFMCTFKELSKLAKNDSAFKDATDALKKGVDTCKKAIQQRCTPSTNDENECVAQAHIPLILAFVDNIVGCMKNKGYTLPPLINFQKLGISPPPRLLPLGLS